MRQRIDVVSSLENVSDRPAAIFVGNAADCRRERRRRLDSDAEIADAVAGDVIETGAHDEQIRTHRSRDARQQLLPDRDEGFGRNAAGRQRYVDDEIALRAGSCACPCRDTPDRRESRQ